MSADGEQGGVIQADRDAAAELLGGAAPDGLLEGRRDSLSLVQTLMRHRLAHATLVTATPVPSDAALMIIRNVLYRSKMNGCSADVYDTADDIIAALAKHPTSPEAAA